MDADRLKDYKAFMAQEKLKYKDGPVTDEERQSFEEELALLRSFRISNDIGPISSARGVLTG